MDAKHNDEGAPVSDDEEEMDYQDSSDDDNDDDSEDEKDEEIVESNMPDLPEHVRTEPTQRPARTGVREIRL